MNEENNKSNNFLSGWKIINDVVIIILTFAIALQGYYFYNLNSRIEKRDKDILEGKQYALAYETRSFLIEYITTFIQYLAYEHNKVLTTHFRNIYSSDGRETPIISRRYYVDDISLHDCFECRGFISMAFPEKQDLIDEYFKKNPNLKQIEPDILDPEHMKLYLNLRDMISSFNEEFNNYARRNKEAEEAHIRQYLKMKGKDKIYWSDQFIYAKNELAERIEKIKYNGEELLKSFRQFNIDEMKFIIEVKQGKPFAENEGKGTLSYNSPNPLKEATLFFENNTYKFDYFKYFVISTKNHFVNERKKDAQETLSGNVVIPDLTYYQIIN